MKQLKSLFCNKGFNYLLLLIALLYSLIFIFFGIDFTDTFFYINMCKDYASSPMLILTSLIGNGWMSLFGDSLVSVRFLNWAILILTVLLPFFILVPAKFWRENLKYVTISIILITILNDNVFGGDVCTLFFLATSASFIIKYYRTSKIIHLLLFGLSSSLLILARFPNILILPASVVLFGIIEYSKNYQNHKKGNILIIYFKKISIYFGVSIGIYCLIVFFIYGSLSVFVSKLSLSILNIDESHSIVAILKGYVRDFVKLIQYVGVCFLIVIVLKNNLKFNSLIQRILTFLIFVFFILFLKVEIGLIKYNWNISLLFSAIVCSVLIYNSILYIQNKEYEKLVFISIVFVLAIIPVLGSNTGLLKFSYFLIAFLPVILASNEDVVYIKSQLSYLYLIFFLFTIYTKMMIVYEDSKITDLKYEFKTVKLEHIKTTKSNVQFVEDVLREYYDSEKENKAILFYGKVSHLFYYLTNAKPLYQNSFWMPPYSVEEVKKAEQIIVNKRPDVFFIPSYPEISIEYFNTRKSLSPFEEMLLENGYTGSVEVGFIVYKP